MGIHPFLSESVICDEALFASVVCQYIGNKPRCVFRLIHLSQIVFLRLLAFFAFPYSFDEISYFLRNVYCFGYLHFFFHVVRVLVFFTFFLFATDIPRISRPAEISFSPFSSAVCHSLVPSVFRESHIRSAVMFTHSLRPFLPV